MPPWKRVKCVAIIRSPERMPSSTAGITHLPGCGDLETTYPHVMARPSAAGWRMFKVLEDNIAKRKNFVEVRYEFAALRLITNEKREVLGVTSSQGRAHTQCRGADAESYLLAAVSKRTRK